MLNSGKLTNSAIQGNASQSPLLSLPPEIRNRIYELVLGEDTLHVYLSSRKKAKNSHHSRYIEIYVCTAKVKDHDAAMALRHGVTTTEPELADCRSRHAACFPDAHNEKPGTGYRYTVALLETCREVHSEAALIPFKINNFTFDRCIGATTLHHFVARLMATQQKSIRSITLGPGAWFGRKPNLKLFQKQPALQNIPVFEQLRRGLAGTATDPSDIQLWMSRERFQLLAAMLKSMSLNCVTVCISETWVAERPRSPTYTPPRSASTADNVSLSEDMEKKLMGTATADDKPQG